MLPFSINNEGTIENLNNYFQKNHEYRLGLNRPEKGFLRPLIGSRLDTEEKYNSQKNYILSSDYTWLALTQRGNVGVFPDNSLGDLVSYPNAAYGYETELLSGNYDFASVGAHGSETRFAANPLDSGSISIDTNWVKNNKIKSTFVWNSSCNNGDIDYSDGEASNLLTEFVYNHNSILLAFGTTGGAGGLGINTVGDYRINIGQSLIEGKSMGEAFLDHINTPFENQHELQREYFISPAIFIGDLTLKLQEHMPSYSNLITK